MFEDVLDPNTLVGHDSKRVHHTGCNADNEEKLDNEDAALSFVGFDEI